MAKKVMFTKGQEVKVLTTRLPIYATSWKDCTLQESKRVLIIDKVIHRCKYSVVSKGKYRVRGGFKYQMRHVLYMNEKHDYGEMHNDTTRYEVEVI